MEQFARTERLLGREGVQRLQKARVAVFGVGGVGGYAAEALARSGVGALDLFDCDRVAPSNLNRQIIALHSTLGREKVEVMAERVRAINPACAVTAHSLFYMPERAAEVDFAAFDTIVDCIDTVTAKLDLICQAVQRNIPIISAMGAGNRLDPAQLRVGDIFETQNCPMARVMRRELRKRGVTALRVAYSTEPAMKRDAPGADRSADASGLDADPAAMDSAGSRPSAARRDTPGSMVFVPAAMGMLLASVVTRELAGLHPFSK